jgi:thiol-disulfide isomerase/thioredoxin
MKQLLACALIAIALRGADREPAISEQEQRDLSNALREAGTNPVENLRAIDKHLAKYLDSPRRPELERAAVRAAIEAKDDQRLILYGERVLAREAGDLSILERVTRALLQADTKETSERALKYARRYEEIAQQQLAAGPPAGAGKSEWRNDLDRSLGQALTYEARATGNLGQIPAAIMLAQRAFDVYPNGESAREIARWLERSGEPEPAARHLADAFTIPDPRTTDAGRARDRARMGELWRQAKGSDAGLGDLLLEAFDRNVALIHARELRLRDNDPNAQLSNPMEFTLSGLDGDTLSLAAFKGKTLVLDFWATWCVPCRAQHPLYEQVKQRFRDNSDVVFLSISTDDDRQAVKPFLAEQKWQDPVWFEDGLSRALAIVSIPTTIVIDRNGKVFSRMNGYEPELFVEMLSERITDALAVQ